MRVRRFNVVCLITSLIGFLYFIGSVAAFIIPVLAVSLGLVSELAIKLRKDKVEAEQRPKVDARSVIHYILTLVALLIVFYSFDVFNNGAYGFHYRKI